MGSGARVTGWLHERRHELLGRFAVWLLASLTFAPWDGTGPWALICAHLAIGLILVVEPVLATPLVAAAMVADFARDSTGTSMLLFAAWALVVLPSRRMRWFVGALLVQAAYAVGIAIAYDGASKLLGLVGFTAIAAAWATRGIVHRLDAEKATLARLREEDAQARIDARALALARLQHATGPVVTDLANAVAQLRPDEDPGTFAVALERVDDAARACRRRLAAPVELDVLAPSEVLEAAGRRGSWWPTRILAAVMLAINGSLVVQAALERQDAGGVIAGIAGTVAVVLLPLHFRVGVIATVIATGIALPVDPMVLALPLIVIALMLPTRLAGRPRGVIGALMIIPLAALASLIADPKDVAGAALAAVLCAISAVVGLWYRGFRDEREEMAVETRQLLADRGHLLRATSDVLARDVIPAVSLRLEGITDQVTAWQDGFDLTPPAGMAERLRASVARVQDELRAG